MDWWAWCLVVAAFAIAFQALAVVRHDLRVPADLLIDPLINRGTRS